MLGPFEVGEIAKLNDSNGKICRIDATTPHTMTSGMITICSLRWVLGSLSGIKCQQVESSLS